MRIVSYFFFLMVFILGRYAWKPLIGAVDERERSIRESIDRARNDPSIAGIRRHLTQLLILRAATHDVDRLDAGDRQ